MNRWTGALLIVIALSSGCFASPPRSYMDEDEASPRRIEVAPGVWISENRGAFHARILDTGGGPVRGALASFVKTPHATQSNITGEILFIDVKVGNYTLFIQSPAFQPFQQEIVIERASLVQRDVTLRPKQVLGADELPHAHDLWDGAAQFVLMDRDIVLGDEPSPQEPSSALRWSATSPDSNANQSWTIPIHRPDGSRAIVLPGTKEVQVTLNWDSTQVSLRKIGLVYHTAIGDDVVLSPRARGGTWRIPIQNASETDTGHHKFSQWGFRVYSANDHEDAPDYSPSYVAGPLRVKIVLMKGNVTLEPPHEDQWAGLDELELRNGSVPVAAHELECCMLRTAEYEALKLDAGRVVPPETTKLRFELRRVYHDDLPDDLTEIDLTWRTGAQNPHATSIAEFSRAQAIIDEPNHKIWEVPIQSEQTDPVYQIRSAWLFVPWIHPFSEDGVQYEDRARDYYLSVRAFRETGDEEE